MIFLVKNKIRVYAPTPPFKKWCKENLEIPNPEYSKKKRMGLWTGGTPAQIVLWEKKGSEIHVPYGCREELQERFPDGRDNLWIDETGLLDVINILPPVPLYDYQVKATTEMLLHRCGILQAPAGSGKTQMGLNLIASLGKPALWITHTKDLLNQSRERAEKYWNPELLGTITEGKVDIGSHVTFATVQTLARLDLSAYSDTWDVVIVDECHRVAGSPTSITMFYRVLNSLTARYKYGLSATVHRADGLIRCCYAMLGREVAIVPKSAVKTTVMPVRIRPKKTGVLISQECLQTDGMINHAKLISYLTGNLDRNMQILADIISEGTLNHSCLILSERVKHLQFLQSILPYDLLSQSAMIDGTMTSKKEKAKREAALEDMRTGKKKILFATYALAKEGLDIPRLDRLFLVTPQKDYAVVTQSIGRIARRFDGKETAVAYDYVDSIQSLVRAYKRRCTTYRKQECIIED